MGISERYTTERDEKAPKKWWGPFMITEVHQEGRFYRLSTGRAAHYENIKPHNPSTEDWCIPADMEEGDYLMMDPACEVNEKGTMSFRTALAADFKREYVEFLWKQRPGIGGVAALPPAASQIPGEYLCFLVTRATEKQHVDPENLVLSLSRLRDFLVEMDVKELSLPVYDPNRGRLHPRELYALVHVIFSDDNIQVYLHKKYYLSIG